MEDELEREKFTALAIFHLGRCLPPLAMDNPFRSDQGIPSRAVRSSQIINKRTCPMLPNSRLSKDVSPSDAPCMKEHLLATILNIDTKSPPHHPKCTLSPGTMHLDIEGSICLFSDPSTLVRQLASFDKGWNTCVPFHLYPWIYPTLFVNNCVTHLLGIPCVTQVLGCLGQL